ncbi:hypothetical protein GOBAR_AA28692 [Gossypium barbadense]|uniref:Amine oxidase domain-containing protein n=1 Tax=Gossypium barbadense TaxID=3634 RepID=A0A2P5WLN8_GOSBA|nr:hypothetical protein GOBAR_AA28692 [Gossypium barbadense]
MKIAVIGGGISGVVSAYTLAKAGADVVLYEKEEYLGGHSKTVHFDGVDLDLGFMVFNRVTYPNMMELFESLGIDMEPSDMSLSVSLNEGKGCEWGSRNGLSGLFAKNPTSSILTFGKCLEKFSSSRMMLLERVMDFSAFSILSFCRNHHLLQLFGRPQWMTVRWRSHCYVNKVAPFCIQIHWYMQIDVSSRHFIFAVGLLTKCNQVREELESRGCQIRTGCEVHSVLSDAEGCTVLSGDDSQELYQGCIMAVHAPDALRLLGNQATYDESTVLGAFQYVYSDIYLHRDKNLMPKNPAAWSAWNFLGSTDKNVSLTYWLNVLQNLGETSLPFLVTLNPDYTPQHTLLKWRTGHPVPSVAATKASLQLDRIQGKRGIWFCGAYLGYGFHEDGLKFTSEVHFFPGWDDCCKRLLEEGGTMFTFEGTSNKCSLKTVIKVHSPHFYWKVMTEADLGLADSYINGDFSFVDKNDGLLNLVMILIANRDLISSNSKLNKKRGWWTPLLFTAALTSAKYFFKHALRQNTLTHARRNVSRHYDLSKDLFALFLDETMTYSCAVFKTEDEDLKDAQHRKISLLIEKARIDNKHEILEIGCGWGSLAIEVVKRTGCKYTGITLSEEQLKLAEKRVKEAGLQENIRFQLRDYRQLPSTYKYDRIISCEMIEAVGHECMEDFFGCCESVLAEDGLLVLQFTSLPEERYDEYRQSSDFIKEYIFPGACIPSLTRVATAMNAASRLCVEHVENIGLHYYQTLRHWRKNFLEKQRKINALGFSDKFIRTWEYHFDYCAAGFKSNTLGNYQVVLSRPGNVAALGNPFKGFPSAA